jgi:hypothetical protein
MKRYFPLLMLLALIGALVASQVATAASSSPRPTPTAPKSTPRADVAEDEDEIEGEEVEIEFEECESGDLEFEFEEDEEEEWEEEDEIFCEGDGGSYKPAPKGAPFVTAPAACQVRQAESTITTLPGTDQVRLDLRYRTWSPTQVTVGLKLKDGKGSVPIEHATRHLSGDGVLHQARRRGDGPGGRGERVRRLPARPGNPGLLRRRPRTAPAQRQAHRRPHAARLLELSYEEGGTVAASHSAATGTLAGSIVWTTPDSR